jgi:hypothetical protein
MPDKVPVIWNIEDVKKLPFKVDSHKDLDLVTTYVDAGHDKTKMIIYNYWQPNPMPNGITDILLCFPELNKATLAVHKTPPATYLPLHHDLYGQYRRTMSIADDQSIKRIIVMLEDSQPGQIMQVGDTTTGHWCAGAVFSWIDNTPHAVYNFSKQDRYAVQITGVLNWM